MAWYMHGQMFDLLVRRRSRSRRLLMTVYRLSLDALPAEGGRAGRRLVSNVPAT